MSLKAVNVTFSSGADDSTCTSSAAISPERSAHVSPRGGIVVRSVGQITVTIDLVGPHTNHLYEKITTPTSLANVDLCGVYVHSASKDQMSKFHVV